MAGTYKRRKYSRKPRSRVRKPAKRHDLNYSNVSGHDSAPEEIEEDKLTEHGLTSEPFQQIISVEPPLEEIIKLACDRSKSKSRHKLMPTVFRKNGMLQEQWNNLKPQIQAKREHDRRRKTLESQFARPCYPPRTNESQIDRGSDESGDDPSEESISAETLKNNSRSSVAIADSILQTSPEREAEGLLCSEGSSCPVKLYSRHYLKRYCGIELEDAKIGRVNGHWLCPTCTFREQKMRESGEVSESATLRIPSKFGRERFDDEEFRLPLSRLWGKFLQYRCMAGKKPELPVTVAQFSILNLPFIRCEEENPASETPEIVPTLRRMFAVPRGALIKHKAASLQFENLDPSNLIDGVVASLVCEMVFECSSPFEDVSIWRDSLTHSFSEDIADMMIQDNRLRAMRAPAFESRRQGSHREDIADRITSVMVPLIGADHDTHELHREIAEIIVQLNGIQAAYKGEFEQIMPKTGDKFDPTKHALDGPDHRTRDPSGRPILMATMFGVRYKAPGKEWRTCSPAKVVLLHFC